MKLIDRSMIRNNRLENFLFKKLIKISQEKNKLRGLIMKEVYIFKKKEAVCSSS